MCITDFPLAIRLRPSSMELNAVSWGAIHQLLSIILKLRILVLLPVSTMPFVVIVNNYS
jgi:hypothetical protein